MNAFATAIAYGDLKAVGVDEISYCKGHKYATIVYDIKKACVVWVGKGKGEKTIDRFFKEMLSDYQKREIKWATCDMSQAYINSIENHCPNVTLILDRFHIVKKLNEAVDEVRKEQWREASGDERKALKGLRWLLYRHSSKRNRMIPHTQCTSKRQSSNPSCMGLEG